MKVEIKQMPKLRAATLRYIGPYNRISEAFNRLGEIAGPAGLLAAKPTMLAIYHDDPDTTPERELRSDAAVVIPEDATVPSGLVEQRLPAGRYACAIHVGPYEELGDAWARFKGQTSSDQRVGDGASYEIYRNDPTEVPKQELRTEMYVPLA